MEDLTTDRQRRCERGASHADDPSGRLAHPTTATPSQEKTTRIAISAMRSAKPVIHALMW